MSSVKKSMKTTSAMGQTGKAPSNPINYFSTHADFMNAIRAGCDTMLSALGTMVLACFGQRL